MDYSEFFTNLVKQELGAPPSAIAPPPPGYVPPADRAPTVVPASTAAPAGPVLAPIGSVRVEAAPAPVSHSLAVAPAPPPVPPGLDPASPPSQPAIFIPKIPSPASTPVVIPPKSAPVAIAPPPTAIAPPPVAAGASLPASLLPGAASTPGAGSTAAPAPKPVARIVAHPAPSSAAPVESAPAAPRPAPAAGLRINKETSAPAAVATTEAPANPDAPKPCFRHMGQFAVEKCYICSKPICPKCMELFGYVCSPLCKSKAEAQGIEVPVFEGQRDIKEAKTWRKTVLVSTTAFSIIAVLLGAYIWWYVWGSRPHVVFSIRFGDRAHSGQSAFAGRDQIVFLHGGTLARHDMKQNKEIWSVNLVDFLFIDEVDGPNFFILLHVVAGQCAAMEKDDLIPARESGLAGVRAVTKTNGEHDMRPGTPYVPPNVSPEQDSNDRKGGSADEDGFAPGFGFLDVTLAFKDGNFDSLSFGLGFTQGRADVAEELHALGTNGLATNVAFFDSELAHVPEAGLGSIRIGGCFSRCDRGGSGGFLVDAQTSSRGGSWGGRSRLDGGSGRGRGMSNDSSDGLWRWRRGATRAGRASRTGQ